MLTKLTPEDRLFLALLRAHPEIHRALCAWLRGDPCLIMGLLGLRLPNESHKAAEIPPAKSRK